MTNKFLKQLEGLTVEKDRLASRVASEAEAYERLRARLRGLQTDKVELEVALEAEQEAVVNRLQTQLARLTRDKGAAEAEFERVRAGPLAPVSATLAGSLPMATVGGVVVSTSGVVLDSRLSRRESATLSMSIPVAVAEGVEADGDGDDGGGDDDWENVANVTELRRRIEELEAQNAALLGSAVTLGASPITAAPPPSITSGVADAASAVEASLSKLRTVLSRDGYELSVASLVSSRVSSLLAACAELSGRVISLERDLRSAARDNFVLTQRLAAEHEKAVAAVGDVTRLAAEAEVGSEREFHRSRGASADGAALLTGVTGRRLSLDPPSPVLSPAAHELSRVPDVGGVLHASASSSLAAAATAVGAAPAGDRSKK